MTTTDLTREQILEMQAGRELDALVATSVMGERFDGDTLTDGKQCWPCPHYSTDIAAALLAVEKLRELGHEVEIGAVELHPSHKTIWNATFMSHGQSGQDFEGKAETAPLAICRAALLAKLATPDKEG